MKRIFALLFTVLCSLIPLWASMMTVSTEHFEIIFDENSVLAAQKIYENGEKIFDSVKSTLGSDSQLHLPVVIKSDVRTYNGQFSAYPSNAIILYNQAPGIGELANSEDFILSMFRHEITHALLHNTQTGFVKKASDIFSDELSLSALYLYRGLNEGLGVYSESLSGNGRVNSPDVTSLVKQAKLDNSFPKWRDSTGAYDSYLNGDLTYHFSGLFMNYIARTYGTVKLEQFIDGLSKIRFGTTRHIFKQVYGISIEKAWTDFENSIVLPEISEIDREQLVKTKLEYTNLIAAGRFVFCLDQTHGTLVRINGGKSEKLSDFSTYETSLYTDGQTFVVPFNDLSSEKVIVKNHEMKKLEEYDSYRAGCTINDSKICLLRCNGDYSYLDTVERKSGKLINSFCLGSNVNVGYFCSGGSKVYFVLSKESKDYIAVFNTDENTLVLVKPPRDIFIRSLSIHGNTLSFSYYTSDSFARYGELNARSLAMSLSEYDISGGVNWPVMITPTDICFIGQFMDGNMIFRTTKSNLGLSDPMETERIDYPQQDEEETYIQTISESYKPYKYLSSFTIIPLYDYNLDSFSLGASYVSMDPAGKFALTGSAGYDLKNKTFKTSVVLSQSSDPFNYAVAAYADFDFKKKVKTGIQTQASFTHCFDSLNKAITMQQIFDLSTSTDFGFVLTSISFAGFQDVHYLDIKKVDYYGFIAAAEYTANTRGQNEFLFQTSYTLPIKNVAPSLKLGFNLSNTQSSYAFGVLQMNILRLNIQKGFLDLYFNRLSIKAAISYQYFLKSNYGAAKAEIAAYTTFTPLIGYATSSKFNLGVDVAFNLTRKSKPEISLVFNTSL